MSFELSERSLSRLEGVHPQLVAIVKEAIKLTEVDFGGTCGVRAREEQEKLVQQGRSQTMNSKHLTGHAVDLVAYLDGEVTWEGEVYDKVAEAMRQAARTLAVGLRWGGAWQFKEHVGGDHWETEDICNWEGSCDDACMAYIDLLRSRNRKPFVDCPHFELFPELTPWEVG